MNTRPTKFTAEKTTFIHVSGATVPVNSFPNNILIEFEVLDAMKQEAGDIAYKLEIITMAIKAKTSELTGLISEHLQSKKSAEKSIETSAEIVSTAESA